jgi:hypothetical protein
MARGLSPQITRAARIAKRGPSGIVLPDDNAFQLHMGAITAVNPFRGQAHFDWGDPENATPTALSYVLPYSSSNAPSVGHNVIVAQFGPMAFILGQNLNPANVVTL